MKAKLLSCVVVLSAWLLATVGAASQQVQKQKPPPKLGAMAVFGHVRYADGSNVPGVTARLVGTSLSAFTDEQGLFIMDVPRAVLDTLAMHLASGPVELELSYFTLWQKRVKLTKRLPKELTKLSVNVEVAPEKIEVTTTVAPYTAALGPEIYRTSEHKETYSTAGTPKLPEIPLFPIKPPAPTAPELLLPPGLLAGSGTLSGAGARLQQLLGPAGYAGYTRYYAYPGGFALTTRIERTDEAVKPFPLPDRWNVNSSPQTNWKNWFQSWWGRVPEGHFRVLVFIVTKGDAVADYSMNPASIAPLVRQWAASGAGVLPRSYDTEPYTTGHRCTVWVYELKRPVGSSSASLVDNGHSVLEHLAQSGVRLSP